MGKLLDCWATSIDLVNTWCREWGVEECDDITDLGLARAIDRLWCRASEVNFKLSKSNTSLLADKTISQSKLDRIKAIIEEEDDAPTT